MSVIPLPGLAGSDLDNVNRWRGQVGLSAVSEAELAKLVQPVEIAGLRISPGDLIHGDCHGVHVIPLSIAAGVPKMAAEIQRREGELVQFCRSSRFSLEELSQRLADSFAPPQRPA